jgi:SAM-dependent methyltransferase
MDIESQINEFVSAITGALKENVFAKITFSGYIGKDPELKNLYIKLIKIKSGDRMNFVYRYKTKDVTKNYTHDEGIMLIGELLKDEFKIATLLSLENDIVFERNSQTTARLRYNKASINKLPEINHDKNKNHKIGEVKEKKYLYLLDVIDENGNVLAKSRDKFKQINHYIELLSSMLKELKPKEVLRIADMGSGKGYLTFALYDYITNTLNLSAKITGVEFRKELVDLCNDIAKESDFKDLSFVEGSIENYDRKKLEVLIALHACNTATDDAIAKGIKAGAELIVVAPCCQHQIRDEIEVSNEENTLSPIIKHGIFMERQAELITDGIRALILEYFGYKTKVVEFISDAHTHKNVMIIGQKAGKKSKNSQILKQISNLKEMFGIESHYLEQVMNLNQKAE